MDVIPDMNVIVADRPVLGLAEETIAEITGRSSKKWAVILIAFLLGATIALVVVQRRRRAAEAPPAEDVVGG